jgi:PAS domain S-box-containing protein
LLEGSPVGIAVIDPQMRHVLANAAYCAMVGPADRHVVGQTVLEVLGEPHAVVVIRSLEQVLKTGEPVRLPEYEPPVGSGHPPRYWQIDCLPLFDTAARVEAIQITAHDVTEHVQDRLRREDLQARLRKDRQRLLLILNHAPEAIAYLDEDLVCQQCNWLAACYLGRRVEQIVGQPLREILPDHPQAWQEAETVLRTGQPCREHLVSIQWPDRPQLGQRHFLLSCVADAEPSGRVRGLFGSGRDITTLMETQQQLHAEQARLRAIMDSMVDGLLVVDMAGNVLEANPALLAMYGVERLEDMPQGLAEYQRTVVLYDLQGRRIEPEHWPLARILRGETLKDVELRVHRLDTDDKRVASLGGTLIGDASGQPLMAVLTVRDVTARRQAEDQLQETTDRLQDVLASITDAHYVLDPQGRFLVINPAAERILFNRPAAELLGKVMWEVYPQVVGSEFHRQYLRAMETRQSVHFEGRSPINRKWFEVHAYPRGERLEVYLRDIDARKKAEVRLLRVNQTLEQRVAERTAEAQQRASQLQALASQLPQTEHRERQRLAMVLHDHLQQLLVGTKYHIGMLRNQSRDQGLHTSLRRVDDLLDQSLEVSRSLTIELSPPILFRSPLKDVLQWLGKWMAEQHGLTVDVQADERIDPEDDEVRVLLFQAIRELLFNVSKHAKVNQARLEAVRVGDQLRVVVSDAGAGFDPHHPPERKARTGGLGLFSIQQRLELLGGRMQVDSAPGEGTRVTLWVSPVQPVAASVASVGISGGPPAVRHEAIRVVLADDHVVMRNGLARWLQLQPGMEVVGQASDGQEAIDLVRQLQPDLVLMDVNMPNLDGVEATRRILAEWPQVRVIGLSMSAEPDIEQAMRQAGASGYLTKATNPADLIALIRSQSHRPHATTE